jgi:outer membrane protein
MKKILFVIPILFSCTLSFGQFSQGRMLVGGGIGFQSLTNKDKSGSFSVTDSKTTIITLTPRFGYFVINNLAVGLGVEVLSGKSKFEQSNGELVSSQLLVGPFVRYYVGPGVFFQGDFNVGSSKDKSTGGSISQEEKFNLSRWSLGAGYAIFLNDHVAIEPLISYQSLTTKPKDSQDSDVKNINSGLNINLGIQVYIGDR